MTMRNVLTLILTLIASAAVAHPANLVSAVLTIQPDGAYRIVVRFDLPAMLLNDQPARVSEDSMHHLMQSSDDELTEQLRLGRDRLQRQIQIDCGTKDAVQAKVTEFPDLQKVRAHSNDHRMIEECVLEGTLPAGTQEISLKLPEVLGDAVVAVERAGEEPVVEEVSAGGKTSRLAIKPALPGDHRRRNPTSRPTVPPNAEGT